MNQPFRPLPQEQSADDDGAGGRAGAEPTGRMAILSIVGFWLVYFVLATARAAVTDMPAQDEMLLRRAVVTLVAMGLTGLLYLLLKRFEVARTGRLLTIAFAASVPLAFAYATVNYIAFYGFPIAEHLAMEMEYKGDKASYTSEPLSMITSSALEWYFFIASWAVMWVALSYAAKVRRVEREAAELRKPLAEHYAHLLVHGALHAQGWDHETSEADAEAMEAHESAILQALGLPDPYAGG